MSIGTFRGAFATAIAAAMMTATANAATYTVSSSTSGSTTTFTVTRSDSADAETVLYRTVSLSAIEGQHFTATNGTLAFAVGETAKSVTVTERMPGAAAYMFQTGTTRSYRFEVTDAAGFPLAHNDRSITTGVSVPSSGIFSEKTVTVKSGTITVTDAGYAQDYHSVPISSYFSSAAPQSYLAAVGAELRMLVTFNAYEKDDGYQYIQIIHNNTSGCDTGADGGDPGTPSVSRYMAGFEHGDGAKSTTSAPYTFPLTSAGNACGKKTTPWSGNSVGNLCQQRFKSGCRASDGRLIIPTSLNTLGIRLNASGSDSDTWYASNMKAKIQAVDSTAPATLGSLVANPGRHSRGNTFYVSVAFSEPVTISGTPTLSTSWGDLDYESGSGGNVLTFSGTIDSSASGALGVTGCSGTISDLAGNAFSGSITGSELAALDDSDFFPITYDLTGGSAATANPTSYTYETADFTLNNPTKLGYDFAGWTGTDLDAPTMSVTVPTASHGARSYTATWTQAFAGSCGDPSSGGGSNIVWRVTDEDGDGTYETLSVMTNGLAAAGGYAMVDFESPDSVPWVLFHGSITNIVIDGGVEGVGQNTFAGCTNTTGMTIPQCVCTNRLKYILPSSYTTLERITIADGVTDIGRYAFSGCSGLTEVTIPDSVTDIGGYAFFNCSGLTNVTIPDSVKSIGNNAFYSCSGLTEVTIPDSVENIGWCAFQNCSGLTNVTIGAGVESIGSEAFSGCSALTEFSVHPDNPNYQSVSGLLLTKDGKTLVAGVNGDVVIPDGVTSIGDAAFECYGGLTGVTMPDSVKSIESYAFSDCSGLTNVTIGAGVESIGDCTFWECYGLSSLYLLPSTPPAMGDDVFWNVQTSCRLYHHGDGYSGWFQDFPNHVCIGTVSCEEGITAAAPVVTSAGVSYYAEGSTVTLGDTVAEYDAGTYFTNGVSIAGNSFTMPADDVSVTAIWTTPLAPCGATSSNGGSNVVWSVTDYDGNGTFETLTVTATGPASGDGFAMADYASGSAVPWKNFRSSITNLVIGDGVTSIGDYAFQYCSGLTEVTIPNGVTNIGLCAFYDCSGLTEVTIGAGVKSIGDYAFYDCSGLTEVTIPDSVKSIGDYAFYDCSGLTNVTIGASVTSIGGYAFQNCSGLMEVTIPDSVKSIGDNAFSSCSGLTNVTIGTGVESIGSGAFRHCSGLTAFSVHPDNQNYQSVSGLLLTKDGKTLVAGVNGDVVIPDGVTSIGDYAFYSCSGLTEVTIPNSVTNIGSYAFLYCSGFGSLYMLPSTPPEMGSGVFSRVPSSCRLYHHGDGYSGLFASFPDHVCIGTIGCDEGITAAAPVVTSAGVSYYAEGSTVTLGDTVAEYDAGTYFTNGVSIAGNSFTMPARDVSVTAAWGTPLAPCGAPSSNGGSNVVWSVIDYDGDGAYETLSVTTTGPASGDGFSMADYARTSDIPWYDYCSSITNLVIGDGVTSIGNRVFSSCSGLTEVTIPDSVTNIGRDAFYGCSGLTAVYITDLAKWCGISFGDDTANPLYYAHNLYLNGSLVTELTIPDGVTSIGNYAFSGCSGLTGVSIPDSVTSIGNYAFIECSETLFDVSTIPGIKLLDGWAVGNTGSLSGVLDLTGCRGIATEACAGCRGITELKLGDSVKYIGYRSFIGCEGMTNATIGAGVKRIGNGAFYGCNGLAEVTIPEGVECIGEMAFYSCEGLTDVTISDSVVDIEYQAFCCCYALANLTIGAGVTNIGEYAFGNCCGLTNLTIRAGVTNIGEHAFDNCRGLGSLYMLPSTPPEMGDYVFAGAPASCRLYHHGDGYSGLFASFTDHVCIGTVGCEEGITAAEPVVTSAGVSYYAEGETVTLAHGDNPGFGFAGYATNGVPIAGNSFAMPAGDVSVTAVWVAISGQCGASSSNGGSNVVWSVSDEDGDGAYETLTVTTSGLASGDSFAMADFDWDDDMDDAILPWSAFRSSISNIVIGVGVTSIGDYAFSGCSGLTEVTIPDSVTSIGGGVFYGCSGLTEVTIPDSVTYIGFAMFYGCSGLTEVTIPDSVTYIGDAAFYGCSGLTEVTIPDSVTYIGWAMFYGCSGLTEVTIPYRVRYLDEDTFTGCSGLRVAYVPLNCEFDSETFPEDCEVVRYAPRYVMLDDVDVPYSWLENYPSLFENPADVDEQDYEDAALATAANGRAVWECYVAGLDPTDASSEFKVTIKMVDGRPAISWTPQLSAAEAAKRKYEVWCKANLEDAWEDAGEIVPFDYEGNKFILDDSDYKFFKVSVRMYEANN